MNDNRRERVLANLRKMGLDQALVCDPMSIWWLCGYYTEPYERFLGLYLNADGRSPTRPAARPSCAPSTTPRAPSPCSPP